MKDELEKLIEIYRNKIASLKMIQETFPDKVMLSPSAAIAVYEIVIFDLKYLIEKIDSGLVS